MSERTLKEGREYVRRNLRKGVKCPCCTQFCKVYKRQIHSTMARMLISLYHLGPGYHHFNAVMRGISGGWGDFSKLASWGLIIEEANDDPAKRKSGMWAITDRGKQFVRNEIEIPRYIETYNNKQVGVSTDTVMIVDCLGKKFNYEELMS